MVHCVTCGKSPSGLTEGMISRPTDEVEVKFPNDDIKDVNAAPDGQEWVHAECFE